MFDKIGQVWEFRISCVCLSSMQKLAQNLLVVAGKNNIDFTPYPQPSYSRRRWEFSDENVSIHRLHGHERLMPAVPEGGRWRTDGSSVIWKIATMYSGCNARLHQLDGTPPLAAQLAPLSAEQSDDTRCCGSGVSSSVLGRQTSVGEENMVFYQDVAPYVVLLSRNVFFKLECRIDMRHNSVR